LKECPDFEVIGEAADGQEALELCSRLKPDLVLMDVIMPRMSGIEAVRAIKRELPHTIVLMMTASVDPNHLAEAIKVGAAGYILKSACPEEIQSAVRRALAGETPLNQEVAMRLLVEVMDRETSGTREERPAAASSAPKRPSEDAPSCSSP
jgi:DNA-binding NarL/FixJ family response regulator